MLIVNVIKKDNLITSIFFDGHAMYDDYGKDIVCASCSVSLLTTVNACLEFDESSVSYEEGNTVKLLNLKKDEITNKLLDNLLNIYKELERQYPKNIKIYLKEE